MRTIATFWCPCNGWKVCVPMYHNDCVCECVATTIASHNIDSSLNHRDSFQFVSLFIVCQSILECWSDGFSRSPLFRPKSYMSADTLHTYVMLGLCLCVCVSV